MLPAPARRRATPRTTQIRRRPANHRPPPTGARRTARPPRTTNHRTAGRRPALARPRVRDHQHHRRRAVDRTSDREDWHNLVQGAGLRRLRIHDLRHSAPHPRPARPRRRLPASSWASWAGPPSPSSSATPTSSPTSATTSPPAKPRCGRRLEPRRSAISDLCVVATVVAMGATDGFRAGILSAKGQQIRGVGRHRTADRATRRRAGGPSVTGSGPLFLRAQFPAKLPQLVPDSPPLNIVLRGTLACSWSAPPIPVIKSHPNRATALGPGGRRSPRWGGRKSSRSWQSTGLAGRPQTSTSAHQPGGQDRPWPGGRHGSR